MAPPISSAKLLQIDRPNPVPRYRFVAEASNCVKGVKSEAMATSLMPIPVSVISVRTVNVLASSSTREASIFIEPDSVNFTALATRFCKTCLYLRGSPNAVVGRLGPRFVPNVTLGFTDGWMLRTTDVTSRVSTVPQLLGRVLLKAGIETGTSVLMEKAPDESFE